MISNLDPWFSALDGALARTLTPLALVILISGVDDLSIAIVCLLNWYRRRAGVTDAARLRAVTEKNIAIFVPCWHESDVIGKMIDHNAAAIAYSRYHFFVGVYPNDPSTLRAAGELEQRFGHVHLAVCPHDGPTSKPDCLNAIYRRMIVFEQGRGLSFDVVVTHDAEDLIHPDALSTINFHCERHDMVQIPVLPIPTPLAHWIHGIYCDEFAEWQLKDMPARSMMGSFIPSNGVGTGYSRRALKLLADENGERIFEPSCLTEDYEIGIRLHRLGLRQIFVPLLKTEKGFVATREFFPSGTAAAIRQRTRWVTGIALQSWERYGWQGPIELVYWFWRDRKGLIGNPLSIAANLLFAAGLISWAEAAWTGRAWDVPNHVNRALIYSTIFLLAVQVGIRMLAVAHVYNWRFALGVPVRILCANYVNSASSLNAIGRYAIARVRRESLAWTKTDHAYPTRSELFAHKRSLGEILVSEGCLSREALEVALASRPEGMRLGEHLMAKGTITERDLYQALSIQQSLPLQRIRPLAVNTRVARALPRRAVDQWKVVPYRIADGSLFLASPEIPTDEVGAALSGFTKLRLKFDLVTPSNFLELTGALL